MLPPLPPPPRRNAAAGPWAADQFTVQRDAELRDPSMLARGLGGNITGCRADVVLCDDVEVPGTIASAASREELRQRLGEIDYVLVPKGMQLYIGTPHTYYSIYATEPRREIGEELPFLAGFRRLELPILDADGGSRWPERFPLQRIEAIRRRSGPAKFASQMLLQPTAAEDGRLNPDLLRGYGGEIDLHEAGGQIRLEINGRRMLSASCWWDPAFGAPGRGDDSVIAAVFTDAEGLYHIHRIAYLRHDPMLLPDTDAATQLCRQVAAFLLALHLPAVRVESNGIGKFLPGLLRRELKRAGCAAAVLDCSSRVAKAVRILSAFDAPLAAGAIHAHDSVLASPLVVEMREWRPGAGTGRDDGLDAVAGCLLSEPVRIAQSGVLPRAPGGASAGRRRDWRPGQAGFRARTDFTP